MTRFVHYGLAVSNQSKLGEYSATGLEKVAIEICPPLFAHDLTSLEGI